MPSPNDPSDLRKYIHMWTDDVKKLNKKEINWLLKTNEQSILTQDQTVVDLSRENLKKIQPEVGEMYAKRATEVLGILHEMDSVIRDRYSLSPNKMDDLLDVSEFHSKPFFPISIEIDLFLILAYSKMQLKQEIRIVLSSFVDEFTFKILSNIERNMTLSGLTQATYKFESSVFNTELFALRDVPLPLPS